MRLSQNRTSEASRGLLLVSMAKFMGNQMEPVIDSSFVGELEPLIVAGNSVLSFPSALTNVKLGSLDPFKEITAIAARELFFDWRRRGSFAALKTPLALVDADVLIASKHSCVFVESVNRELSKLLSEISHRALQNLETRPRIFS